MRKLAVLALLCAASSAHADPKVDRLVVLGKLWGDVKFRHPALVTGGIDWDGPLVAAISKVRAATTDDQAVAAMDEMLARLGDPLTRVVPAASPAPTDPLPGLTRVENGVLVVDLRPLEDLPAAPDLGAVEKELAAATAIVFDQRFRRRQPAWLLATLEEWAPILVPRGARRPGLRWVVREGYKRQVGSSDEYVSAFMSTPGEPYRELPSSREPRVVFLVGQQARLGKVVFALQASGRGLVVAQGKAVYTRGDAVEARLLGGRVAELRSVEWTEEPFGPDVVLPAARDGLPRALALAARRAPATVRRAKPYRRDGFETKDDPYATMSEPALEYRLLALFRYWNVIHHFYPYLELIDDWDPVLAEFIPRMEVAATARDYARVLLALSARVADGHSAMAGYGPIRELFGVAHVFDVELRWIDAQAVVTRVGDRSAQAGLAVGDVVVAVDSEPTSVRIERMSPIFPGSRPENQRDRILDLLLSGPDKPVVISVQGGRGPLRSVTLARQTKRVPVPPRPGLPYKLLEKDLGYVDLVSLTAAQVPSAFEALKSTRAIIFDMRGYPKGTFWLLGPRVNTRKATSAAVFRTPRVDGRTLWGVAHPVSVDLQPIDPWGGPVYAGKLVVLIDERAISQSEHTCLFLEAAGGATFVGTPTAGANGDTTVMVLPGGVQAWFTGADVRHADGRQLQRVGIQPDVRVAPTLAGIRAGKDEVLERAIKYIRDGR